MKETPTTPERCRLLLSKWRRELHISNREKIQLAGEMISLDRQLKRLINKSIRIGVFGRVGVGKSSLLNALLEKTCFETDVGHGCTRNIQTAYWDQPIKKLQNIQLVDTPGIDEISAESRCRLAAKLVLQIDLILFVIDSDLNRVEFDALDTLLKSGKPILLKRGFGSSIRDLLGAAEHILLEGNPNVLLCERGVVAPHTHRASSRFLLDLQAVPALQELTHLVFLLVDF